MCIIYSFHLTFLPPSLPLTLPGYTHLPVKSGNPRQPLQALHRASPLLLHRLLHQSLCPGLHQSFPGQEIPQVCCQLHHRGFSIVKAKFIIETQVFYRTKRLHDALYTREKSPTRLQIYSIDWNLAHVSHTKIIPMTHIHNVRILKCDSFTTVLRSCRAYPCTYVYISLLLLCSKRSMIYACSGCDSHHLQLLGKRLEVGAS